MNTFFSDDVLSGKNWKALERAVARLMVHLGWKDVSVIGGSGDQGGDVLGMRVTPEGLSQTWVVQVKAVTGGNYVKTSALEEVTRAACVYGSDIAVVATNGHFAQSVINRNNQLGSHGFCSKLWNGATLAYLMGNAPVESFNCRKLRTYQQSIIEKVIAKYDSGEKRALYIVATGLGKTVIAASIARALWERGCRKILVLCHATDLVLQLEQGFWPSLTKDIPTSTFSNGLPPRTTDGIAFGLFQSLIGYLNGLEPETFDAIIVDEAHHACASGFRQCLERFKPRFLVGMTATPWRGDGQSICSLFGEPVERVSLVDGMALGYLSKVDYRIFCDNISWDEVKLLSKKKISVKELNKRLFLPQRDEAVIEEIKKTIRETTNPRIAIFSPSLDHCEHFAAMLRADGISCVALSCKDKVERRKRLMAFSSGKCVAIAAVDLMNEGIDIPDVNILVFLRATHSRRIFVQQLGRGLRLSEGKEKVIVLDFVSDIRRMADVVELNQEGKEKGAQREVIYLQQGFVSFTNKRMESFVRMWLEDVADLGEANDDSKLTFPDTYGFTIA